MRRLLVCFTPYVSKVTVRLQMSLYRLQTPQDLLSAEHHVDQQVECRKDRLSVLEEHSNTGSADRMCNGGSHWECLKNKYLF